MIGWTEWWRSPDPEAVRASLFWMSVLAHVLGDFVFQGGAILQGRREGRPGAYLAHGLVHLGLLGALGWPALSAGLVGVWLAVAATHVAVDAIKDAWQRAQEGGGVPSVEGGGPSSAGTATGELRAFLLDQAAHLWLLGLFARLLPPGLLRPWPGAAPLLGVVAGLSPAGYLGHPAWWRLAAVYVGVILGGAVLVRLALKAWRLAPELPAFGSPERSVPSVGAYVGMLERALLLTLLLLEAPAAVGFVVAAKSVARFKELEDRSFAEYYLVGTLMSVVVAMGGYLLLRQPL